MKILDKYRKLKAEKPSKAILIIIVAGLIAYSTLQSISSLISPEYQLLKEVIKKINIGISLFTFLAPINIIFYYWAQRIRRKK